MTGPDDYRGGASGVPWRPAAPDPAPAGGGPPGGSWRPTGTDPASGAPGGWAPDPRRPGPTWSAAVTGPGGPYATPGAAGSAAPPASTARAGLEPAKLFGLVIAALGAVNFAFGFLPQVTASRLDESLSVYAVGPGYVPILLLIAGLLALAAFLPGSERSRLAVAAVSVGGAVGALISLGTTSSLELLAAGQVSKGLGAVLLTIFGLIQAVVAIAAYVVGADFGARSGQAVVTVARDPANGTAGDLVWTPDHGPVRSTPWSATAHPAAPAPGAPPQGSVAYYAGYAPAPGSPTGSGPAASGWAPPADDDRPTGPQQVVDPNAAPDGHSRQGPAERELPRVAPVVPDQSPAPTTHAPDDASGPTEVYQIPPRPAPPDEPGRS